MQCTGGINKRTMDPNKSYSFDNAPPKKYKSCAKQLMDSIISGSLKKVQSEFNKHRNKPIMKDKCFLDYELLKVALKTGHEDIINCLLELKCRVRNPNKIRSDDTPLHMAVSLGNEPIIQKILKSEACIYDKNKNGDTPIQAIYKATRKQENFMKVHTILNCLYKPSGAVLKINPDNKDDIIHFHIACVTNNRCTIEQFQKHGFDINSFISLDYAEFYGLNPVHYAAKKYYYLFLYFLETSADLSVLTADGLTPLHILKHTESIRHIIPNVFSYTNNTKYINAVDRNGISHFHLCCTSDNIAQVQVFINNGVDVNGAVLFDSEFDPGYTPLHYAINSNSIRVTQLLLENGADCSKKDAHGNTPLHLAHRSEQRYRLRYITKIFDRGNHTKFFNSVSGSGISHFHLCCMTDSVENVQVFINNGVDVNSAVPPVKTSDCPEDVTPGSTPLHFAIKHGALKVVKLLLQNGADCSIKDINGDTPLHLPLNERITAGKKSKCIIRLIFKYGNESKFVNSLGSVGISHFHLCCMTGTAEDVQTFIDQGVDVDEAALRIRKNKDYPGFAPLHFAAKENDSDEVIRVLVRNGANCNKVNKTMKTPLHVACGITNTYAQISNIQALLENGADVTAVDRTGCTPLHVAFYTLRCYENEIFDMLISKMPKDENLTDNRGLSYFHIVCTTKHVNLVTGFLEAGVAVDGCVRSNVFKGYAPLHFAALYNQLDVVKVLLSWNAQVDIRTCRMTPLHLACDFSFKKTIEMFDQHSSAKLSNLDWSLNRTNHLSIIKLLLKNGADVNSKGGQGQTALLRAGSVFEDVNTIPSAFLYSKMIMSKYFIESDFVTKEVCYRTRCTMEILLSNKADINARTSTGSSILHIIADSEHFKAPEELVPFLVDEGADVNAVDNLGCTPLHLAVTKGRTKLAQTLIKCKADRNPKNDDDITPLEIAYQTIDQIESVQVGHIIIALLECGCDPDTRKRNGMTLLEDAIEQCQISLIEKLLYYGADINLINLESYRNSRTDFDIFRILFVHVQRLLAVGYHVDEKLRTYCFTIYRVYCDLRDSDLSRRIADSLKILHEINANCIEELDRMKDVKVDKYTTLYSILKNNSHENSKYVRNNRLAQILGDTEINDRFPLYIYLLRVQLRKGLERRDMIDTTKIVSNMNRKLNLPDPCCDRILLFLTNEEILNLKNACINQS